VTATAAFGTLESATNEIENRESAGSIAMNRENTLDNASPTMTSVEAEVRQLREENERLRKENAELRFERDSYYQSLMAWAKEKFASEPLPPIPPIEECQDIRVLLEELERESTER
jgi:molecular chaperone GrpE (heat shock protein)